MKHSGPVNKETLFSDNNPTTQEIYFSTLANQQTIQDFCVTNHITYNEHPFKKVDDTTRQHHILISLGASSVLPEELNTNNELKISFLQRKLSNLFTNNHVNYSADDEQQILQSITAIQASTNDNGTFEVEFDKHLLIQNLHAHCTSYPMHPLFLHYINDFPQFNSYMLSLIQPPFMEQPLSVMEILKFYDLSPFVSTKLFDCYNNRAETTFDLFEFLEVLYKRFFLRFQTESLLADLIVHNMPKTIENFVAIYNSCATILDEPTLDVEKIYVIDCSSDSKKQRFYENLSKFPQSNFKIVLYHDDIAYLHCDSKLATITKMT